VLLGLQAHRLRALPSLAIRLGGPALLLTGWFYALNVYRYGEPTGTGGGTAGTASPSVHFLDALTGRLSFVGPLHYLVTEVYERSAFWVSSGVHEYSITAVALLLIAAAIGLSVQSARSARARAAEPELVPAAWLSVTILGAVPTLLIAQHMSAGGGAHPRYLMPVLPILAVAAALVVSRINRWFAVLAVAGFALAELTRVRAAGDLARFGTPTPPTLGGQPFIALSVVVALVGAAVLVVALAVMAASAPEP
jgi:hypothetical protein